jgi:hypothetical protein
MTSRKRWLVLLAGRLPDVFRIYAAEDLGLSPRFSWSPPVFRRFLKPRMRKMIDLVHSFGARAFHHDDGKAPLQRIAAYFESRL